MNEKEFTDSELENAMIATEDAIIAHSKIPIQKSFVFINIDNKPFRVRVYECGNRDNQTLVCTLGYIFPQLHFMHFWTRLAEKFRVVVFEHGSCGLNTNLDDSYGLKSSEAAEEWVIDFNTQVFARLDIPTKFHLLGQCHSGHLISLYASKFPERVLSLFLVTPTGTAPFEQNQNTYLFDYRSYDIPKGHTQVSYMEWYAKAQRKRQHMLSQSEGQPYSKLYTLAESAVQRNMYNYRPPYIVELFKLWAMHHLKKSVVPTVEYLMIHTIGFAYYPMQSQDRLGNDKIDFPIAFVYGENDWNGSDGADELVKMNKHYKSGRSQIFTMKNCSHELAMQQTEELCRIIFGFIDGSLRGHF